MDPRSDLGLAIASAARSINKHHELDETLQAIVEVARDSVPGFEHVGISALHADGRVETRASTDDLVARLDEIQYRLEEGPCVDTLRDAEIVVVPELRHEQRWPRYVQEALGHGVTSQLAVTLYLDEEGTLGGLNLYSTRTEGIDPDAEPTARLFAAHAAIALGHATKRQQLSEALRSRKVIGQAIGIVMERYGLDEDRAFAFLVRASSHSNTKLRDVAEGIVRDRGAD